MVTFWKDYDYLTGRSKPIPVTHCQAHHDETEAHRRGGDRPGYSVRLRLSEAKRAHCLTCGPARPPAGR